MLLVAFSILVYVSAYATFDCHFSAFCKPTIFICPRFKSPCLRWLETVSSTYILMGRYNHSLSLDATIMVSQNCPTIDKHVVNIFVTR